jgi:hypothetical protein
MTNSTLTMQDRITVCEHSSKLRENRTIQSHSMKCNRMQFIHTTICLYWLVSTECSQFFDSATEAKNERITIHINISKNLNKKRNLEDKRALLMLLLCDPLFCHLITVCMYVYVCTQLFFFVLHPMMCPFNR